MWLYGSKHNTRYTCICQSQYKIENRERDKTVYYDLVVKSTSTNKTEIKFPIMEEYSKISQKSPTLPIGLRPSLPPPTSQNINSLLGHNMELSGLSQNLFLP